MTLYDNTDLEDAHCMCSKKVKVSYSAKSFDIYDKEEDARQNKNKYVCCSAAHMCSLSFSKTAH